MLWVVPALSVAVAGWLDQRSAVVGPLPHNSAVTTTDLPPRAVPLQLLPLPYPYNALEPDISERTVRLHHDTHQAGYVRGANTALQLLDELDRFPDRFPANARASMRRAVTEDLAFQLGGVRLHELYWGNLSPNGGGRPRDDLRSTIERDFGSLDPLRRAIEELATKLQGSGWVILTWEPRTRSLLLEAIGNHENHVLHGAIPLLVIDVWEHAYYLDHPADKRAYLDAFFRKVSWPAVATRLAEARACSPS
jgi:Fe-Mn family superoxide dismutase